MNPRVTHREKGLIKAALRRVFSRSELRAQIIEASIIKSYKDPNRKAVKTWCKCAVCLKPDAKSYMAVDHIIPIVDVTESAANLTPNQLVDRMWCPPENLQVICKECHKVKTQEENKERRAHKKLAKTK